MQEEKHILIFRLSAMGDVAMTVPVIQQLLQTYPQVRITVLSSPFYEPLFAGLPRCTFYPVDTKNKHKGITGITSLFRTVMATNRFDAVADLHNVLRSKIWVAISKLSGIRTAVINKGRKEKRALTRKENKQFIPLKTSHQRYADVFAALGFPLQLDASYPVYKPKPIPQKGKWMIEPDKIVIGIAPFAKHEEKMYPLEKMEAFMQQLNQRNDIQVFLFGGGEHEKTVMQEWEKKYRVARNLIGKFSFEEELAIISNLKLLVSMDSANMHLASLFQVPVISVWGATHPFAGFTGWGQTPESYAQIGLYCRPCSVFGNKPCYRGDHACMQWLEPEQIYQKIQMLLRMP